MGTVGVSVILPFRNAENTLERAIKSVLIQRVEWELILVDNASTDSSRQLALRFVADRRVNLVEEPMVGVVHAMNAGLKQAQGKWVARMDADDEWHLDKLAKQLTYLQANQDCDVLGTQADFASPLEKADGLEHYVNWSNTVLTFDDIQRSIFIESPFINPSIVFRKSLIVEHGVYAEGDFPEDYEMFLRWHSRGVRMEKLPEKLMTWHDGAERLTRSHSAYTKVAFNTVKCEYLAEWLSQHNSFHPHIWVWGASRRMRRNAEELEKYGIHIEGFIDTQEEKTTSKPCIHFESIPSAGEMFIVSFVAIREAKKEIRHFLDGKGYTELQHFVLAG